MAKIGNNAAYIQSKALEGDVSRDMQYWNNDAGIRRREETAKEKEAYDRAQTAKKEKQDRYDKYIKPLNSWDTGSQSMNEVVSRTLINAQKQYPELISILENKNATDEERIKAQLKLENINKLPEQIKAVTNGIQTRNLQVQTALAEGKIKKNEKTEAFQKAFQGGFSTFETGLDDMGNLMIAYKDLDGDGKNDILGLETFDSISKGLSDFKFDPNFDLDKLALADAEKIGTLEKKTDSNFVKRTKSSFNPEAVLNTAKNRFIGPQGELTLVGKSAMQDLNYKDTPENREKIINDYIQKINDLDKVKDYTEVDNSSRISASKEARLSRESKSEEVTLTEPVKPTEATWGGYYKSIPNGVKSVGVSGEVTIGAIQADGNKTISNGKLKNYTFDKYGRMVVQLEVPKTKTLTKQVYTELENAVTNATTEEEKAEAMGTLEMARFMKTGDKISIPGQNEIVTTAIRKEQEAEIADKLGGTVESARERAGYAQETKEEKKTIDGF